jgi:hypothetical protein
MESDYGHWTVSSPRPDDALGFVYLITHKESGNYYYGQKKLSRRLKRKPLKGRRRNRISITESDWKQYCGSGIVSEHAAEHKNAYEFLILDWCFTKTHMDILETAYIINSVYDEKCLNQCVNIRCRVRKPAPSFLV